MGFLSTIFGTNGAYKKAIRDYENARQEETSYYQSLADTDFLQRSENQAALTAAKKMLADSNRNIAASAAVSGMSDEAQAIMKGNAADTVGQITTDIASNATQQKQQAVANKFSANEKFTNYINQTRLAQAAQETAALSGLMNSAISAGTTLFKK